MVSREEFHIKYKTAYLIAIYERVLKSDNLPAEFRAAIICRINVLANLTSLS